MRNLPAIPDRPTASDLQRWGQEGIDPKLGLTADWLKGAHALYCVIRPTRTAVIRNMAFAYDELPSGHQVLCTVRHAFSEDDELRSFRFFRGAQQISPLQSVHSKPIYPTDGSYDIAFVVIPPTGRKTDFFDSMHYDQWSPVDGGKFFTSVNLYQVKTHPVGILGHDVPAIHQTQRAWIPLHGDHVTVDPKVEDIPRLEESGHRLYGIMPATSVPGCSGSPVWDQRLRLVGMNLRGSADGNSMAYLFAGDIRRLYETAHEEIQSVASSVKA